MNGIVVFLALSKDKPHKSNVDMIEYDKRFLAHEGERESRKRKEAVGTTTKLVNFDGLWGPFFQGGLQENHRKLGFTNENWTRLYGSFITNRRTFPSLEL